MPLVALDGSWALCMPKKTGSQSLVGMLTEDCPVAHLVGGFHDSIWDGIGQRLMIVREPRDRLASMYWFAHNESRLWCEGDDADKWLAEFLQRRAQRKNWSDEWHTSQWEMAQQFRPDMVFRFEHGLQSVLDWLNVSLSRIRHANRTDAGKNRARKSFYETFGFIPDELNQPLNEWIESDGGGWY